MLNQVCLSMLYCTLHVQDSILSLSLDPISLPERGATRSAATRPTAHCMASLYCFTHCIMDFMSLLDYMMRRRGGASDCALHGIVILFYTLYNGFYVVVRLYDVETRRRVRLRIAWHRYIVLHIV